MRGRMTPNGYRPENADHMNVLTERDDRGRRVGRDPMTIAPAVLTASGHGPRRTASIVAAMGTVELAPAMTRHKDLRRQCLGCAENAAEVRRCAIIDCPIWPYRMGRNPHNPMRGYNPFATP